MNDKPHISQSQVNRYLKCGLQYKYHYIDGNKKPISSAMLRGSSIDHSANLHFTNGLNNNQFIDYAIDYHDRQEDFEGKKQEVIFDITKEKSRDMTKELAETYYGNFSHLKPSEVQLKVEQPYDENLDFIGYIDLLIPDYNGSKLVLDNKVWARDRKVELNKDIQLVKYAELLDAEYVGLAVVHYERNVPKASFKVQKINKKDIDVVNRRIDKAVEGIRKEVFSPPDMSVWWCTPKWCGYWDECEFGGG